MTRSMKFVPAISALILAACGGSDSKSVPAPCFGSDPTQCWVREPPAGSPILEGTGGMAGASGGEIGGAPVEGSGGYFGGGEAAAPGGERGGEAGAPAGGGERGGEAGAFGAGGSAVGGEGGAAAAGGDTSGGGGESGGTAGAGSGGSAVDPCPWVSDCYARIDACRSSGAADCDSMIPTCGQLAARCGSSNPPSDPSACRHNVDVCLSQYDDCVALGGTGCLHIIDVCAGLAHDCE